MRHCAQAHSITADGQQQQRLVPAHPVQPALAGHRRPGGDHCRGHLALGLAPAATAAGAGVAALALFNLYAQWRVGRETPIGPATAFVHVLVDVAVLTWMIGWSGGLANPFGSLFLVLIALAAFALPLAWGLAVAAACVLGYFLSAAFGLPLPHGVFDPRTLHLWGVAMNFVLSSIVVLVFTTRLALSLRRREQELSTLRERFARNEGIVTLATHAASVAHELNTPGDDDLAGGRHRRAIDPARTARRPRYLARTAGAVP